MNNNVLFLAPHNRMAGYNNALVSRGYNVKIHGITYKIVLEDLITNYDINYIFCKAHIGTRHLPIEMINDKDILVVVEDCDTLPDNIRLVNRLVVWTPSFKQFHNSSYEDRVYLTHGVDSTRVIKNESKEYDVCFIKPDSREYSSLVEKRLMLLGKKFCPVLSSPEECYSKSKIVLNVHNQPDIDMQVLNPELFQAMACGSIVVSDMCGKVNITDFIKHAENETTNVCFDIPTYSHHLSILLKDECHERILSS